MNSSFCENPTESLRIQKVDDYRIAPHLHISAEIIFVETGAIELTIGSLDYSLSAGDYAFILPNSLHSVVPTEEKTSVYVINCKQEVIPDIIRRLSGLRPASPVLHAMEVPELLSYAVSAITTERDKYIANSLANLIANIVTSKLRFAEIRDGVTTDLTNRLLTYLGLHFRESISLDQLAEVMNVSRFHLSHIFSGKLGIGFKEYLNNLRVECAKTMLRSTDTPISDICMDSGFENQRTFNRVFRELTGASPRDYRLHREDYNTLPDRVTPIAQINIGERKYSSVDNVETLEVKKPTVSSTQPTESKISREIPATNEPQKPKKKEQAWFL